MPLFRKTQRARETGLLLEPSLLALALSPPLQPFGGQQLLLAAENDLSKGILMTLRTTTAAICRLFMRLQRASSVLPALRREMGWMKMTEHCVDGGEFAHPVPHIVYVVCKMRRRRRKEKLFAPRCRVAVFPCAKTKSVCLPYIWPLLIITDNICNRRGWREIIIFLHL